MCGGGGYKANNDAIAGWGGRRRRLRAPEAGDGATCGAKVSPAIVAAPTALATHNVATKCIGLGTGVRTSCW